ncbi:hypothetical protein [Microbacterium sp.]|uniref:hypothetical protein n=1 Tax=Microbacterium sp. TaxID=51671 RepID=UPI0039E4D1D9
MGFDDIVNKGKELFEDAKDKVEGGFEAAKDKAEEVFGSDKVEEVSDQVLDAAAGAAKKVAPDAAEQIDSVRDQVDGAIGS